MEEYLREPKRIIAIIPARSGSKGLKDKNIKEINRKPLLAYTIESATKTLPLHTAIPVGAARPSKSGVFFSERKKCVSL